MTRRLLYPNIWAEGGTATDPDLDTTAPSYIADRYVKVGWKAEKPPEEWQNFLTQITDQKIVELILSGIPAKDASVTYQDGALYLDGGKIYVVVGGAGQEVISLKNAEFTGFVNGLNKTLSDHLAADNPHQDTVNTLVDKSYIKTDVNNFFGSASDPATIVYHKARTGAGVHGETPAQIGTIPSTGGTFTGPVIMEKDAIVNLSPSKLVHLNRSTAILELASGTMSMGIASNGRCWFTDTTGTYEIMTEANYADFQARWNNRFSLPLPYLRANFNKSLSDANSVGSWVAEAPNTPEFGNGLRVDNNDVRLIFNSITTDVTVHLLVVEASGAVKGYFKDFANWNFHANTSTLQTIISVSFGGTDPKYIREYTVYQTLNMYQKSMLVR